MNSEGSVESSNLGKIYTNAWALPAEAGAQSGTKKTRVDIGNTGDKSLLVAARVISNKPSLVDAFINYFHHIFNYVKVVDGNQTILLKINSLRNRLGLSASEIKNAESTGELKSLISDKASTIKFMGDLKQTYGGHLLPEFESTLSKVIQTALPLIKKQDTAVVEHDKKRFAVSVVQRQDQTKKLELFQISKRLGKGGFGEVFETMALHEPKSTSKVVLKEAVAANVDQQYSAADDVRNEVYLLNDIHENGPVCGIQTKPHRLIELGKPNQVALLGARYEGDFSDAVTNASGRDPMTEAFQLLAGLKALADKKIVHGDIKPENMLYNRGTVHIADFGGARKMAEGLPSVFTPIYLPYSDWQKAQGLENMRAPEIQVDINDALNQLKLKTDVFAMGCSLYYAFSGTMPYKPDNSGAGLPDTSVRPPPLKDVHPKINALIQRMMDADSHNRPTADEAFQEYSQVLQQNSSSDFNIRYSFERIQKDVMPKYINTYSPSKILPANTVVANEWDARGDYFNLNHNPRIPLNFHRIWPQGNDQVGLLVWNNNRRDFDLATYNRYTDGNFNTWLKAKLKR